MVKVIFNCPEDKVIELREVGKKLGATIQGEGVRGSKPIKQEICYEIIKAMLNRPCRRSHIEDEVLGEGITLATFKRALKKYCYENNLDFVTWRENRQQQWKLELRSKK